MQHATERVERPGESQEALDGKKKSLTRLCGNLVPLVCHQPLGVRFQHAATSRQHSRSCGSTSRGSRVASCGVAVRNCAGRPGSTELIARSSASGCVNWSVHTWPKTCVPLVRILFTNWRPSLDVFSRSCAMASARVEGMKYLLLLRRPCCLASSSCRDRFALGAARARPPGVCCASSASP